jgi:hypothetical protein
MTVDLVRFVLRTVMAAAPSWSLWLGLISFMTAAGTLKLFYERCRRRTYIAVLDALQPGTSLLDGTHRGRKLTVVRLLQPLIAHSDLASLEDLRR